MTDDISATFTHTWASISGIEQVLVLRPKEGYSHPKVKYYCPPRVIARIPVLMNIYLIITASFLCIFKSIDLIAGVHMSPRGMISYYLSKLFRKKLILHLVEGKTAVSPTRDLLTKSIAFKTVKCATMITTTGESSKKELIRYGLKPEKIISSISVIDTEKFYPLDIEKKWDIISLGRIHIREKGLDVTLKVIQAVNEEFPINAAIAGGGPDKKLLQDMINDLGISDCVTFLGYVLNEDRNRLYNEGKIFLLTSPKEGFPTTIVEAMCAGACCVSSDVGDVSDIVENGRSGILIKPYDAIEFYKKNIVNLLRNPGIRNEMTSNAMKIRYKCSYTYRISQWEQKMRRAKLIPRKQLKTQKKKG